MQRGLTRYLRRWAAEFETCAAQARRRGDLWYAEMLGRLAAAYDEYARQTGADEGPPPARR